MSLTLSSVGLLGDLIGVVMIVVGVLTTPIGQIVRLETTLSGIGNESAFDALLTRNDLLFGTAYLVFGFGAQFIASLSNAGIEVSFDWLPVMVAPFLAFCFVRKRIVGVLFLRAIRDRPSENIAAAKEELDSWLANGSASEVK